MSAATKSDLDSSAVRALAALGVRIEQAEAHTGFFLRRENCEAWLHPAHVEDRVRFSCPSCEKYAGATRWYQAYPSTNNGRLVCFACTKFVPVCGVVFTRFDALHGSEKLSSLFETHWSLSVLEADLVASLVLDLL